MSPPCWWNEIHVGPGNQNFVINATPCVIPTGTYASFLEWRNAFMTAAQAVVATLRSGITAQGYFTLDNNGGAAYTATWTDLAIPYLMGYTGVALASLNAHIASRRIGASLYLEHGGGPLAATLREHDPKPGLVHVSQTESLDGTRRTTRSGVERKRATFEIQFLDNTARLVSPAGAVGFSYALAGSTAAYDIGLTQYTHAMQRWRDSTNVAAQGYSDGRRVRYFSDAANATFAQTAAAWAFSATSVYTDWTVDAEDLEEFRSEKARPPLTTKYHLSLGVSEYR